VRLVVLGGQACSMAVPALLKGGLNTDPLGEALKALAFNFTVRIVDISPTMLCMGLSEHPDSMTSVWQN